MLSVAHVRHGLGALSLAGLAYATAPRFEIWFVDWKSYAAGVERMLSVGSPYHPDQLGNTYQLAATAGSFFVYPPTGALLLLPFAATGVAGLVAWLAFGLAVLLTSIVAVLRKESAPLLLFWPIVAATLVTGVLPAALNVANASMLVAGVLAWSYARGGAGLSGGLLAALKVSPGLGSALDGWRGVGIALVVVACGVLTSVLILGPDSWAEWVVALTNGRPACGGFTSLTCQLVPIVGWEWARIMPLVLASGLGALAALASARRVRLVLVTAGILTATTEIGGTGSHFLLALVPLATATLGAMARMWHQTLRGVRRTTMADDFGRDSSER